MVTLVLIPGAGSGPPIWRLVRPLLEAAGHAVVTPVLPCGSDTAALPEYAEAVLEVVGDRADLVVVGQSIGAFTAAEVAARRAADVRALVHLNGMIPLAGETPGAWWANTRHDEAFAPVTAARGPMDTWTEQDMVEVFLNGVPADVVAGTEEVEQGGGIMRVALERVPDVPTHAIAGADDVFFPLEFQRRIVRERLRAEPDVLPGGHVLSLSHPRELAAQLLAYR